jgi:hypothetical protein
LNPSEKRYGAAYHHIDPRLFPYPDGDRRLIATETPHDPSIWLWTSADRLALRLIGEVHQRGEIAGGMLRVAISPVFGPVFRRAN